MRVCVWFSSCLFIGSRLVLAILISVMISSNSVVISWHIIPLVLLTSLIRARTPSFDTWLRLQLHTLYVTHSFSHINSWTLFEWARPHERERERCWSLNDLNEFVIWFSSLSFSLSLSLSVRGHGARFFASRRLCLFMCVMSMYGCFTSFYSLIGKNEDRLQLRQQTTNIKNG